MKESAAMLEIRKIRDENSLRHLTMTDEEISKEHKEAMDWFIAKMAAKDKAVKIVEGA